MQPKLNVNTIIFSKNRAAQLDLLLRSLNIHHSSVLFTFDPEYGSGYAKVKKLYPKVKFVKQNNFQKDLVKLLTKEFKYVLFLVDDDVMIDPFKEDCKEFKEFKKNPEIVSLSLRLSPKYRYHNLPEMSENKWKWKPYEHGSPTFNYRLRIWGCPNAVGGQIFRRDDILPVIKNTPDIKTPNFLELAMSKQIPDKPYMICCDNAKFINNEINQVQNDFKSHTTGPTALELEEKFEKGFRLSLTDILVNSTNVTGYFHTYEFKYEIF